jgi:hypothetical protein
VRRRSPFRRRRRLVVLLDQRRREARRRSISFSACRLGWVSSRATSHSQTVNTRKPKAISSFSLRWSRLLLPLILSFQNRTFRLGKRDRAQPRCPCQKHPCTKMAHARPRLATSGEPGRSRLLVVNRMPRCQSHRRSNNSGLVSRWRICFIRAAPLRG